MLKCTFAAGRRTVTVEAKSFEEAALKARAELDKRALKSGNEVPVAWDLVLLHASTSIQIGWNDGE
jgi:hypothetical protein